MLRMTMRHYFGLAYSYRWYVLVPAVFLFAVATAYAIAQPDQYQATAMLIPPLGKSPSGLIPYQGDSARELLRSANERMMSFDILQRIADDLDLYPESRKKSGVGADEIVNKIRRHLQINVHNGSNAIFVTFAYSEGEKPNEVAAKFVNRLVKEFVESQNDANKSSSTAAVTFLDKEREDRKQELGEKRDALYGFERQYRGQLPEDVEANKQKVAIAQQRVLLLNNSIQRDRDEIDSLTLNGIGVSIKIADPASGVGGDTVRGELTRMLVGAQKQRTADLATHKEDSRVIRDDDERIAQFQAELAKLGSKDKSGEYTQKDLYQFMLDQQQSKKKQLEKDIQANKLLLSAANNDIAAAQKAIEIAPTLASKHENLQREYEDALTRYEAVMKKQQEARMGESFRIWNPRAPIEIAQKAHAEPDPVGPKRAKLAVLGLFAGLALGLGLAFLRIRIDRSYDRSEELRLLMPGAVLVTLPEVNGTRVRVSRALVGALGLLLLLLVAAACVAALGIRSGTWGDPSLLRPLLNMHLG